MYRYIVRMQTCGRQLPEGATKRCVFGTQQHVAPVCMHVVAGGSLTVTGVTGLILLLRRRLQGPGPELPDGGTERRLLGAQPFDIPVCMRVGIMYGQA